MKHILMTYSKNNFIILSSCIVLVILNISNFINLDMIAYILLAMFVYDINVSDKIKGNSTFLESLPITLGERYILKVIIPFLFLVLISIGMQNKISILFLINSSLSEILLSSSVIVIASLFATKLNQYILYILVFSLTAFIFSFLPFSEFIISVIYLIASYYIISKQRVQKNKLALLAITILLPSILTLHFAITPLYRSQLDSNNSSVAFFSATQLVEKNDDQKAIKYLTNILVTTKDTNRFRNSLDVLNNNQVRISIDQEKWLNLFKTHKNAREEIIEYFIDEDSRPQWVTHFNLYQFEEVMFNSGDCNDLCHEVVMLISSDSITINQDHINKLLADKRINRTDYAIRVVIRDGSLEYKNEVIKLLGHPDEEIQELALEYLTDITKNDLSQELTNIKGLLKENNSELNIKKAKDFFMSNTQSDL